MPRLLIATTNIGKVNEYRRLLGGCGYEIITPDEIGVDIQVVESGSTFKENAALKAAAFAWASGLLTLADDSGLEVDALDGHPGVLSARYGGENINDSGRNSLLLNHLKEVPDAKRSARFRCVIALCWPGGRLDFTQGTLEGVITREPKGSNGFGYDHIFCLPELGKTVAELLVDEKNRLSHRAQAAREACDILRRSHGI